MPHAVETIEELAVANAETPLASQRSHFLPNASGFQIVGGQFVLGNVNNHPPVPASPPTQTVPSPTGTATLPSLPIEILSESEIYCQRLLYQKRGFPLYMPDPQKNLPAEYRTSGVRIGHVGRVTPEGAFDPFFNIYYSAEHPINSRGVPENFVPLPMYREEDVFPVDRKPGDYVSTPSVQESDLLSSASQFLGREFLFTCKGPDGALLALPHGSRLQKLENLEGMRRYAAKNAESWYKYANAPEGLGRRLVNGSLYLITGWEKSESWGMATFQNLGVEKEFQLSFDPYPDPDAGFNYRWRRGTPARTKDGIGSSHEGQNLMNQTLFIHGFSISLGEGIWGKLFPDVSINKIADSQFQKSHSNFVPFSSQASSSFVFSLLGLGASYGERTKADHQSDEVQISEISPTPSVFHPSKIINDYLLREAPQATVAITHDDDWCRIFQAVRLHDFFFLISSILPVWHGMFYARTTTVPPSNI
ncbi:hypothetical protein FB451DRAFT_268229 [Mycena latifolia]|nr:hypothetical protein FB451DRAFT_268229 [Mycena latifolia]